MSAILFFINPVILIIYKLLKYKYFLKEKKEVLCALSLAIFSTYIPYERGDSIRYAFRFYQFRLYPFEEAYNKFVPLTDKIYYNFLFIISKLGLPYNFFVFIINFFMIYIMFHIIRKHVKKKYFFSFCLMYNPINLALGLRFPLANYMVLYSFLCIKNKKTKYILLIVSIFIHKIALVLILICVLTFILCKYFKNVNIKKISLLVILLGNVFYLSIELLQRIFIKNFIIQKLAYYKTLGFSAYTNLFLEKANFLNIFHFLSFFLSYLFVLQVKENNKNYYYYFLVILGGIIVAFLPFSHILFRYSWIYNIFFIIYISQKKKQSILLYCYKMSRIFFLVLNVLTIIYWSTFIYITKYKSIPFFLYPTPLQIIGYDNAYNKKIENIAFLKEEEHINLSRNNIMADLEKYYNNNEEN